MNTSNNDFIASLINGAKVTHLKYGVPASVTIAQAILESGWGRSGLTTHANNLFGIKADRFWIGDVCWKPTTEYYHGHKMTVNAPFRRYPDLAASLEDHGKFLSKNPRYKPAFQCADGVDFAKEIAECGYATDPNYAHLVMELIDQYNLTKYDI